MEATSSEGGEEEERRKRRPWRFDTARREPAVEREDKRGDCV